MELSSLFTSHMVFPAHKPLRFFGKGSGKVSVTFDGDTREITADKDIWSLSFPARDYGGPYTATIVLNGQSQILTDIWIGDVYLFAGQSNMQYRVCEANWEPVSQSRLRMFFTDKLVGVTPYGSADGWKVCRQDEAGDWSALAYFAGQELAKDGHAVGIIGCYQSASVIESWLPAGTQERLGFRLQNKDKHRDHFWDLASRWNGDGMLYSYALGQVVPFPLTGVVWYQGESDTALGELKAYEAELEELIRVWRRDFRDESLPFIVVQIADFDERRDEAWAGIQKIQAALPGRLPFVQCVVSRDICASDNIHPAGKPALGARIATALRKLQE